jgi:DNA polymerase V
MLLDLSAATIEQGDLFSAFSDPATGINPRTDRAQLLATLDQLNQQVGRGTLWIAAEGVKQPWRMRCGHLSPTYASRWDLLPVAKAIEYV